MSDTGWCRACKRPVRVIEVRTAADDTRSTELACGHVVRETWADDVYRVEITDALAP